MHAPCPGASDTPNVVWLRFCFLAFFVPNSPCDWVLVLNRGRSVLLPPSSSLPPFLLRLAFLGLKNVVKRCTVDAFRASMGVQPSAVLPEAWPRPRQKTSVSHLRGCNVRQKLASRIDEALFFTPRPSGALKNVVLSTLCLPNPVNLYVALLYLVSWVRLRVISPPKCCLKRQGPCGKREAVQEREGTSRGPR